jgi:hypothetical protein
MVRFAGCSRVLDAYAVATLFIRVATIHLENQLDAFDTNDQFETNSRFGASRGF